jgi:hypothetical protein
MSQTAKTKATQSIHTQNYHEHNMNKKIRAYSSVDLVEALLTLRNPPSQKPLDCLRREDMPSQIVTLPELHSTVSQFTSMMYRRDEIRIQQYDTTCIYKYSSNHIHSNSRIEPQRSLPIGRPLPPPPELPEKCIPKHIWK